jgi:hypothetical protein
MFFNTRVTEVTIFYYLQYKKNFEPDAVIDNDGSVLGW